MVQGFPMALSLQQPPSPAQHHHRCPLTALRPHTSTKSSSLCPHGAAPMQGRLLAAPRLPSAPGTAAEIPSPQHLCCHFDVARLHRVLVTDSSLFCCFLCHRLPLSLFFPLLQFSLCSPLCGYNSPSLFSTDCIVL